MNIVEKAIARVGGQVKLAAQLTEITAHPYTQPHVAHWKRKGYFPSDVAMVVAGHIFNNEITAYDACPKIKRAVKRYLSNG